MKIKKIIRSKRKTIALHVCEDTTLIIRAPFHMSDEIIYKVIFKHNKWLEKKKREILSRDSKFVKKEFVNGEDFLCLGEYYRLHLVKDQKKSLIFQGRYFLLRENLNNPRNVFIEWYKKMACEKIFQRVLWYAQEQEVKFNNIKITNAQKQWGSCSHLGNLNFTWRLIMAPLPVIDYVVVHELMHLNEKNHSKIFWNKVKILMPEYKKHKNWLKYNGHLLRL